MKSNFEYFRTIFFANLKLRGFLIVSIPLFIEISAVFVGSTPNTLGYSFFTNSKKEPSLLPTSKILGFLFLESFFISASMDSKLYIFSLELPLK